MVMGGNDGFNVLHDGTLYGPTTRTGSSSTRVARRW